MEIYGKDITDITEFDLYVNNIAQFEKAFNNRYHEHLICQKCGKVEEFADSRINEVVEHIEDKYQFSVHHHLLYIYGLCKACRESE